MFKQFLGAALAFLLLFSVAAAHDLFLKLDDYFVKPGDKVSVKVLNGSFQDSEGAVSFQRLKDASLISPDGSRLKVKETDFTRDEKTAFLNLEPNETGTYVAGLSTMPREIALKAADFNEYLEHDGIPDTLAERKRARTLNKNVRERYSKHVKTIFQVGEGPSESYQTALGYPVEIVPQNNPYSLKAGETFEFLCLKDGKPLVNQFVMAGREDASGKILKAENVRTDQNGAAKIKLAGPGKWYVRFIQMTPLKNPKLNYESQWATLTFAVR